MQGTLSNQQSSIQSNGTATATFTNNNTCNNGSASFASGQTILTDNLPNSSNISYSSLSANLAGVSCAINASKDLSCTASSALTLAVGASFNVQFTAVAAAPALYANPRSGGSCSVDPGNMISESSEVNNTCGNNVTVARANTTTTITPGDPDPSVVGQAVTVSFSVVRSWPAEQHHSCRPLMI